MGLLDEGFQWILPCIYHRLPTRDGPLVAVSFAWSSQAPTCKFQTISKLNLVVRLAILSMLWNCMDLSHHSHEAISVEASTLLEAGTSVRIVPFRIFPQSLKNTVHHLNSTSRTLMLFTSLSQLFFCFIIQHGHSLLSSSGYSMYRLEQ